MTKTEVMTKTETLFHKLYLISPAYKLYLGRESEGHVGEIRTTDRWMFASGGTVNTCMGWETGWSGFWEMDWIGLDWTGRIAVRYGFG